MKEAKHSVHVFKMFKRVECKAHLWKHFSGNLMFFFSLEKAALRMKYFDNIKTSTQRKFCCGFCSSPTSSFCSIWANATMFCVILNALACDDQRLSSIWLYTVHTWVPQKPHESLRFQMRFSPPLKNRLIVGAPKCAISLRSKNTNERRSSLQ